MAANPVNRMAVSALACFALVTAAAGTSQIVPAFLGLVGPLLVTIVSWTIVERVYLRASDRVSGALIKLLAAKMIFFGGYVAAVVLLAGGTTVFAVSFVSHYVLLHLVEAFYLRRLFLVRPADGQRQSIS